MSIRQPAVAGMFYPEQPGALARDVQALFEEVSDRRVPPPKALIVPHAGYVYSGATAAEAYRALEAVHARIERVVLFGPAHRVYLQGMAVPSVEAFATPLGSVPLDRAGIDTAAGLAHVCVSDLAHRDEHSLEVQLPFLQTVLETFTLVPIVVGECAPDEVAAVMDALWGGPETLVVVSSDLSHYHRYEQAQALDADTCRRILARATTLSGEQACGAHAINGLMCSERAGGLDVMLVDARNSGDTSGRKDRVVGYGAFVLH